MRPRDMMKIEFWQDWRPWMAFVIIGLFFVAGWVGSLNNSALKRDAFHRAEVARCMASRPVLAKFSRHVQGVNHLTRILVLNSQAVVRETRRSDPQYTVRVANLHRLARARAEVAALPGFPVPTVQACKTQN